MGVSVIWQNMVPYSLMKKTVRFQTISYQPGSVGFIPYIRITNKGFLEKYGFRCREKIVIIYQKEKLTVFSLKKYQKIISKLK